MTATPLLLAFDGHALPAATADLLHRGVGVGLTPFVRTNVADPAQVRDLTDAARRAAGRPLLVCADAEGGQLLGLGPASTPFAGNLALGAADDPDLTERVATAIGLECRAMGVDVDYAPVCDLLTDPSSPTLSLRCFGADPDRVAVHAAAFTRGLAAAGVAACAKHFPGSGDSAVDPHHQLPTIPHHLAALRARELRPFAAALEAGAPLVMSAHVAYPGVTGRADLPATLAAPILVDLLRGELGFTGLVVTDALDMGALGERRVPAAVAALRAGADLLLATAEPGLVDGLLEGLAAATAAGELDPTALAASAQRAAELAADLERRPRPDLDVVGCAAHRALAAEVARRAVTLVRDPAGLLPLDPTSRVLAVQPRPRDLTPADTSSAAAPELAAALRLRCAAVDELVVDAGAGRAAVAAAREAAGRADVVVLGTVEAHTDPLQVALAEAVAATGTPLVTVSLRTPADASVLPSGSTHLAAHGLLRPCLDAVADVLVGHVEAEGTLPIPLPPAARHGR